ncbi:hypothetical protein GCM10011515_01320 [Tsuneonella deserti]|uniref:EF-hand domain-containing protein n=1 Tax=Tsuneonella deserti TaxID=2035528 RepID=A0ABQ1RXI7_9SPHN|nr:EF-hand domain-containing protein [Tsuneonella deserti]GGD85384.1 hypothetical protein GCM10011515_01320 [Tsuneonella deserti]
MRKLTLSIAAATLATAGVALAAPGMTGAMPQGDMTRAQAQAMATEHFAKMDLNSDGKIDAGDREARRAKMFDRLDTDKNGSLSRDEFNAAHRGRRGGMNHQGMNHEGMNHGQPAGDGAHRMGGKRGMRGHMGMMTRMADANNDGAITQAEFTAAVLKHFDSVDTDHSGTVTAAERQAAHAAMKAQWQSKRPAPTSN